MRRKWCRAIGGVLTVLVLPVAAGTAGAGAPKSLPEAVAKAWTDAEAKIGWMQPNEYGVQYFHPKSSGKAGELPGLLVYKLKPGLLAALPDMGVPFGLRLNFSGITDAGLKELAGLKSLRVLFLESTGVRGPGLKELAALPDLRQLELSYNPQVTGVGLKELATLKDLRLLQLRSTATSDAGLKEVAELKGLRKLNLSFTKVTDAGLGHLAALPRLEWLDLSGNVQGNPGFTDAGLKDVGRITTLKFLDLSSAPNVTNEGVKHLAGLQELHTLDLSYTKVTEAGLKDLAGLKALRRLNLHGVKMTPAGFKELATFKHLQALGIARTGLTGPVLQELKQALPGCQISD
jgi:internalin A